MKYGTIFKIVRLCVTLAVVGIFIVPLLMSVLSVDVTELSAGVESRYEYDEFPEEENLRDAFIEKNLKYVDGEIGSYIINHKDGTSESILHTTIEGDIDAINNNCEHGEHDEIVVLNSDEKPLCQKSIVYQKGINIRVITGAKLPGELSGMVSLDMDAYVTYANLYNLYIGKGYIKNGYVMVDIDVPDIVYDFCLTFAHNSEFDINIKVAGLAGFKVDFSHWTDETIQVARTSKTLTLSGDVFIANFSNEFLDTNQVTYEYKNNAVVIRSSGKEISEELSESLEKNGYLRIDFSGSKREYTLNREVSEDLIAMIKYWEEHP